MPRSRSNHWQSGFVLVLGGACLLAPIPTLSAQGKADLPPDRATALQKEAKQYLQRGNFREAEKTYLEAVKGLEQQMAAKNADAIILSWCQCRADLAHAQFALFKFSEAKALLTDTISYLKKVIPLRPKDPAFRHELAKLHGAMSVGYNHFKLHVEAEASQEEGIGLLKKLSNEFPDRTEYCLELSKCLNRHGRELVLLGRFQNMEANYKESLRLVEKLRVAAPKSPEYAHQLALTYSDYAFQLHDSGRFSDAIEMTRAPIRLLSKLETDHPDQPQ
jgi:tetratricopeptide (TPR) repeat protein